MYLSIREICKKYNANPARLTALCEKNQIPHIIKEGKLKKDRYYISENIIKQWLKNREEYYNAVDRGMISISQFIRDNHITIPPPFIYMWINKNSAPVKEYTLGLKKKVILGYPNDLKKWFEKNRDKIIEYKKEYQRVKNKEFRIKHKISKSTGTYWQPFRIISNEEFERNLSKILAYNNILNHLNLNRFRKGL